MMERGRPDLVTGENDRTERREAAPWEARTKFSSRAGEPGFSPRATAGRQKAHIGEKRENRDRRRKGGPLRLRFFIARPELLGSAAVTGKPLGPAGKNALAGFSGYPSSGFCLKVGAGEPGPLRAASGRPISHKFCSAGAYTSRTYLIFPCIRASLPVLAA